MTQVDGKVVLITGAASGIERSAALLLAEQGSQIIITDINEAEGLQAADAIAEAGGEALFLRQDVTSEHVSPRISPTPFCIWPRTTPASSTGSS